MKLKVYFDLYIKVGIKAIHLKIFNHVQFKQKHYYPINNYIEMCCGEHTISSLTFRTWYQLIIALRFIQTYFCIICFCTNGW